MSTDPPAADPADRPVDRSADRPAVEVASASRTAPALPPALWPEVSALFDDALALPAAERPAWLAALDAARPAVAVHLRRLLAAHHTAAALPVPGGELLAAALGASAAAGGSGGRLAGGLASRSALVAGQQIGIYRLLEPLGAGGMATVWAAEQTQGVFRRVALKLPHPGIEAPAAMARRFESERDLLAGLEHPHIARLYDAGIGAAGQPFLAMELIEGQALTEHARGLPLRRRLALFLQVLEAVSFAHGRLVIHRDLKPSNLLVTANGQVKLLDFGIARLLVNENTEADAAPGPLSGRAFTPDCASPEQLAGAPLGAASDVYSLGVVLYELLTGTRPYALDRHGAAPLATQLAAAQPSPPSNVAPLSSPVTRRELAGDLDAIVARAMALDPGARYPSVEALAADLQRHLGGLPVAARRGGRAYVVACFLRRHRLAVATGSVVLLALSAGLGAALWQAQEASAQAARATAVQGLLVGLFDGVSPEQLRGGDISARELVRQGSQRAEARLTADPLLRADLLRISGDLLFKLQAWQPAAEQLQAAVALYDSGGRAGSADALDARFRLMDSHGLDEDCSVARQHGERLLQLADASFGPRHRWAVSTRLQMAACTLALGRPEAAIGELQAALALPQVPGEERDRLVLLGQITLGNALLELGRPLDAREQFDRVLAGAAAVPALHQADLLGVRFARLKSLGMTGEIGTIETESAPLLVDATRLLGEAAPLTLMVRDLRAQALALQGQFAEAVALQREVLRLQTLRPAADAEPEQHARGTLAGLLALAGEPGEGVPMARSALAFFEAKYPAPDFNRETHRLRLAGVLLRAGRHAEAAEVFATAVRHMETLPGHATHPRLAEALSGQALATRAQGDPVSALALIDRACAIPQPTASRAATRCAAHQAWLHGLASVNVGLASGGQPHGGLAYGGLAYGGLARFDAAAPAYAATLPPGHAAHAELTLMRADLLAAAGRRDEAQAETRRGADAWALALGRPWQGPFVALR